MFFAGLDIGSTITKIVIRDENEILAALVNPTGPQHRQLANKITEAALAKANLTIDQIDYIVVTGYGRVNVPFADRQVSEITCHMRGIIWLFPNVRTIIDIGGQDSKGIKVVNGKMRNFIMNDKCAAGTGRFLEVIADSLGLKIEEIGEIALRSKHPADISKICTVFAEQEVLLRLSEGVPLEDILYGLHLSMAKRIHALVGKIGIEKEVVVTGGGAMNNGLFKCLEERIGFPLHRPAEPLLTGALGASVLAQEYALKAQAEGSLPDKSKRKLTAATFFDGDSAETEVAKGSG